MKTKLLIFGITGDLSTRKLLPALEQIIGTGNFENLSVIGVSRHDVKTVDLFFKCDNKVFLDNKLSIFKMDLTKSSEYKKLKQFIDLGKNEQLIIYLAVPPQATSEIVDLLGENGINTPNVKVLFEKPFGTDLSSAKQLMKRTAQYYKEEQTYRIDHYLAKEMAQNIVAFRAHNALFSDIWNNNFIESIEIIASEKIDIEGRVQFYEQTGALRDLLQGHLIQLLALVLMEIPKNLDWDKMPEMRLEALRHLYLVDPRKVVRAQYKGYREEVKNPDSMVETFVSVDLVSHQSHWQDVPIKLTTGKALAKATTEIRIILKKTDEAQSNRLIFRIQPNEGIDMELFAKKPGYSREFETRNLSFSYPSDVKLPDAYEHVIVDAISSQKSLFTTSGEVLQSWRILQPILDEWSDCNCPLKLYKKASSIDSILA
jgi:glucose-6-phosphate 1-dehydrogenase